MASVFRHAFPFSGLAQWAAVLGCALALVACSPVTNRDVDDVGGAVGVPALAGVPGDTSTRSGFHRQVAGALVVTALFDGHVYLPRRQLQGIDAIRLDGLIQASGARETGDGIETAVNAYLIERGDALILVDTGTENCFGSGLGQVPEHLRRAGYRPEQVTDVLLTHGHPDHICGLIETEAGEAVNPSATMAYPNATVWIDAVELGHWQSDTATARIPPALHFIVDQARAAVAPYEAAGRLRGFVAGEALPGGATALATPGHTPGHTSFLFDAGAAQAVLVWGDVLHYHAVQFAEPVAAFEVDEDQSRARQSRRDILEAAARQGWLVAGAHLPFPGLGTVQRDGDAYAWLPVR